MIQLVVGREVLVEAGGKRFGRNGLDICTVEDTEWRGKVNGQWRAMEQAAVGRG